MKKLLGILVLGLLFTSSALSKKAEHPKLPKDVAWGDKYFKSLISDDYKDYGMQVVDKKDGHPVRLGNKSIRFEVRPGDCSDSREHGYNDCEHDSERHELSGQKMSGGTWWYAWSIYFPEDHFNGYPTFVTLGQFHQEGKKYAYPVWMFTNYSGGYWFRQRISNDWLLDKTLSIRRLISRKKSAIDFYDFKREG